VTFFPATQFLYSRIPFVAGVWEDFRNASLYEPEAGNLSSGHVRIWLEFA
jgi:hypothetical protein